MKKNKKTDPAQNSEVIPIGFAPSQEQIDAFARRLMPEIKRFFADWQMKQEFADWLEKHQMVK